MSTMGNGNDDDDVNSISYQHRWHCDVDNIDSTMETGHEWKSIQNNISS